VRWQVFDSWISPPKKRFMRVYWDIGGELFENSPPELAFIQGCGDAGGEFHHQRSWKAA